MRVLQCACHLAIFITWLAEIQGFSMEEKCKHLAGKGYIGDPSDCRAWGFCQDNKLSGRSNCNEGLLFNFRDGTCRNVSNANCHSDTSEICAKLQPEDYIADPANCRRYIQCKDIGENSWIDCGEGQVFSNEMQTCLEEVSGCPQDNICSYMKDGSLVGNPNTCRSYYKCQNGFGIQINCTGGRYFNRKTGLCQIWMPDYCDQDEDLLWEMPPSQDYHICNKYYQMDRDGAQLIPDLMTCYGYYNCTSQFDKGQWSSCPWGKHFEWWSEKCGSPKDNSCSYDRCGNVNQFLMATINTGCQEYTICQDNRSMKSEKCPTDVPYFDELLWRCTKEFPNYRVCFMDG
ncbi:peritrophin-44 [Drosophila ficusphila]|uniref:peritrophin-44 n=1 Tax=Drosophila ficusphila TaxID=30025 RepID=UPI0007E8A694|nr:peritrophin-44 [Drosophila ficusphila]